MINVGVDVWGFRPVSIEAIEEAINGEQIGGTYFNTFRHLRNCGQD